MSIFKRAHRRSYEPPVFDVVALGPAGSGKTVFLSSLFHQLNYQSGDRAYHLETDAEQRIALASVHRDVSDTSCDWPDSTNGTREFAFDCVAVDGDGNRHTMLRVRCLDFAGGCCTAARKRAARRSRKSRSGSVARTRCSG